MCWIYTEILVSGVYKQTTFNTILKSILVSKKKSSKQTNFKFIKDLGSLIASLDGWAPE